MFLPSISAFKETAFLLAVSSAALTHALAKACSSGRMERCTCDDSPGIQHREAWQWGVCGDNLKYSTKFLKKFLGQKRVSKDLRAQVDAHNINVGIRVSVHKQRGEILHQIWFNRILHCYHEVLSFAQGHTNFMYSYKLTYFATLHDKSDITPVPSGYEQLQSSVNASQNKCPLIWLQWIKQRQWRMGRRDDCRIAGARCSQA